MLTLGRYPKIFSPTVLVKDNQRQSISKDVGILNDTWNVLPESDHLRYQYLYSCPTCVELSERGTSEMMSINAQIPPWHHHHHHQLQTKHIYPIPDTTLYQQEQSEKLSCHNKSKVFMCPYCSVSCSNRGQLLGHVRIHTGERPFVCQEPGCNKAFIRNEELTRHRRIHTGERPYRCTVCSKAFTRKDHLNKHVKIHVVDDIAPH